MNEQTVQEARRRAFRYYYEDGLAELSMGFFFVLIAAAMWAYERVVAGTQYGLLLALAVLVFGLLGAMLAKRLISLVKERITYPRTGKVTYNERAGNRGRWLVIAAALVLAAALIWLPGWLSQASFTQGALLTVILLYMGGNVGLPRMQAAALLPAIVGLLAAYYRLGDILGSALVFASLGLLLALLGGWAWVRYLRENPAPDEEGG